MDREERDMKASAKVGKCGGLLLCVVAVLLLFAAPASAKKTHLLLETFGSASQPAFLDSASLAVDQSNGDLLVMDSRANTISRFKPNGEPDPFTALGTNVIDAKNGAGAKACGEEPASCDLNPEHPGFSFPTNPIPIEAQIAVDNSGTATDGDIYVAQFTGYVDVFAADGHFLGQLTAAGGSGFEHVCGVAVDPGGNVFLAEFGEFVESPKNSRIYKFKQPAGPHNPLGNADGATLATFPKKPACQLAAGAGPSAGDLFVNALPNVEQKKNSLRRLNADSGSLEGAIDPGQQAEISVDPKSGHVYAVGGAVDNDLHYTQIKGKELTSSGTLASTFRGGMDPDSSGNPYTGIAVDGESSLIYTSFLSPSTDGGVIPKKTVQVFGPLVTVPDVSTGDYAIEGDTSVGVNGTVNPDGQVLTECFFEYETDAAHQEHPLDPFAGASVQPCAESPGVIGSGTSPVEVHAELSGLAKETAYHYRLVATNANAALYPEDPDAVVKGEDRAFKTPSKPAIKGLWAADVSTTDATLKVTLNPENSPTAYRFEWGLDSSYGDSSAEFSIGSDGADHTVGFNLSDLEPATTYHYRLVATNGIGVTEATDRQFTTFAVPAPPGGGCENASSRIGFGALLPDCRAYEMVSPVDKGGGAIYVMTNEYEELAVLEQSADSGEKLAYGSNASFGDAVSGPFTTQYIAQRVAGEEWRTHAISPPRGRGLIGAAAQFYTEFKAFSSDLCSGWLVNFAEPPLAEGGLAGKVNLYRRNDRLCGEEGYEALAPLTSPLSAIALESVSADGAEAIFQAVDSETGKKRLYASAAGSAPRLVCVLPDGQAWSSFCGAGMVVANFNPALKPGAVSADGSRVFWSDAAAAGHLYLRENPEAPESARLHGAAAGKGILIGPAAGTGNVVSGSELVKSTKPEPGSAFAPGQKISDSNGGIPAGATIVKVEETAPGVFTLTLSAKATKTKIGDALTGVASETVPGLVTESGAFAPGQEISAPAIPPGTTVVSCSPSCGPGATSLALSTKATKTEIGAPLSATSPCTEAATKACTIAVSKAAEEEGGTGEAVFWGASKDGSRAIFTTGPITSGILANGRLYSFEPDGETTQLLAKGVYGVMGISEDAERVYFASSEKIPGSGENSEHREAEPAKPNLYLYEVGGAGASFVATLAKADLERAVSGERFGKRTSRVGADGANAAFDSVALLTGYDNAKVDATDCEGGSLCREIYLYDAGAKKLVCASCNPSGERPAGPAQIPFFETSTHGAHILSDDGSRLYFESDDALSLRDTNGQTDVYQWEAPGAGSCEESLPTYSTQDGGCIDLVSSGQSHLDSRFVEADPSGENVFIATASSFLPQDPGGVDIYDARVDGGLPIPAGPAPGCEGEACQGPLEAPNDPTPSSLSFEGAGNVVEEPSVTQAPCAKGKVRKHGKCMARKHRKRAKRHQAGGANRNRGAAR